MNINLLPKENKKPSKKFKWKGLLLSLLVICPVFCFCLYLGYLRYFQIYDNEVLLSQINLEIETYQKSYDYDKVKKLEVGLEQNNYKTTVKARINEEFYPLLEPLKAFLGVKRKLAWFDTIELTGNGGFKLTGGVPNYKSLAFLVSEFERNNNCFSQVKPEDAVIIKEKSGKEYVQFKITGILVKRGGQQ